MEAQVATKTKTPPPPVDEIHAIARENARRQAEAPNGDVPEAKPKPKAEPLLKLTTVLEPRPTIEIDDVHYELRHRREFSIVEQHQMQVEGDEFDGLWERKEQLNSKQRQRLKTVLDSMFDKVIMAPSEVKDALDDESRRAVVLTFTRAPLLMAEIERIELEDDEEENPISDT
jgi:hypothetical protein